MATNLPEPIKSLISVSEMRQKREAEVIRQDKEKNTVWIYPSPQERTFRLVKNKLYAHINSQLQQYQTQYLHNTIMISCNIPQFMYDILSDVPDSYAHKDKIMEEIVSEMQQLGYVKVPDPRSSSRFTMNMTIEGVKTPVVPISNVTKREVETESEKILPTKKRTEVTSYQSLSMIDMTLDMISPRDLYWKNRKERDEKATKDCPKCESNRIREANERAEWDWKNRDRDW